MKTSNYILIAVFTLVVISILTFFITSKQHENEGYRMIRGNDLSEIPLPDINVIVTQCSGAFIRSGEQNKLFIVVREQKLGEKPDEVYHIGNDTLYIHTNDFPVNVICSHSVSVIVPKDSKVTVTGYELSRMTIENTGGYVDFYNNTLDTLQIQAIDNAAIRLYGNRAKFVSAHLKDVGDFSLEKNKFDEMDIRLKN